MLNIYPKCKFNFCEELNDLFCVEENSFNIPTNFFTYNNLLYIHHNILIDVDNKKRINLTFDIVNDCKKEDENSLIDMSYSKSILNECFLLTTPCHRNYYHFIMDLLPKIFMYREQKLNCDIYFERIDFVNFQKQFFDLLEFDYKKIKFINDKTFINKLYVCSSSTGLVNNSEKIPYYPLLCMKNLLNKLLLEGKIIKKELKNIYISRKNSYERKIINENEFYEFIKKYNFELVELEKLNVLEQIELFYNANIVIAPHGAGAVNLVFGGLIYIEIHDKNYIKHDSCFYQICCMLNIKYNFIHSDVTGKAKNAHFDNFVFNNFDELDNLLKLFL